MNNNKLIAEFMGYPPMTDAVDDRTIAYDIGGSIMNINNTHNENDDDVFHPDDMKFHSSWDWLMPVLIKIERIIVGEVTWISTYCDIEREYKRAVEWIKKYNDNPKHMTLQ
jgi:hypothetical protein